MQCTDFLENQPRSIGECMATLRVLIAVRMHFKPVRNAKPFRNAFASADSRNEVVATEMVCGGSAQLLIDSACPIRQRSPSPFRLPARPPERKVSPPAHAKHHGWYVDLEFWGTCPQKHGRPPSSRGLGARPPAAHRSCGGTVGGV